MTNADAAYFTDGTKWERTNSDYGKIKATVTNTDYKFMQTEDNQKFTFNQHLSLEKAAGEAYAHFNSLTLYTGGTNTDSSLKVEEYPEKITTNGTKELLDKMSFSYAWSATNGNASDVGVSGKDIRSHDLRGTVVDLSGCPDYQWDCALSFNVVHPENESYGEIRTNYYWDFNWTYADVGVMGSRTTRQVRFKTDIVITDVREIKNKVEEIFYSKEKECLTTISFSYLDDKSIIITLKPHSDSDKKNDYTDELTKLPNRKSFSSDLNKIIDYSTENNKKFALLLIDIDDIKSINSSQGFEAGDLLLVRVATILKRFEKNNIYTYRFGADEFLIIIKDFDIIDSLATITDTIFEVLNYEGINISGGISIFPDHSKTKDDLLKFANIAKNNAKKDESNQFKVFNPDMQKAFIRKMLLQNKMTTAVLESAFTLYYQPQFNVKTSNLRGFEALIRWRDKELGDISPALFIPLAEETGLIIPIGTWVLNTAFSTLKKWQIKYNFKGIMSVNISPKQLKQHNFIDELQNLLVRYNLSPSSIELEITEGIMIENMDDTISKLKQIKDMGIRVSLDDFGTGYSSLSYLQMLPLDTLKIDKSFIRNITAKDGIQANITNSIINMVSKMGLDTIAEGVEKNDQLEILKKFDCNIIQGYLRGKPMPEFNCNAYLAGDNSALLTSS
jgi:diguanylate cyclase (GGDEF)-like protein